MVSHRFLELLAARAARAPQPSEPSFEVTHRRRGATPRLRPRRAVDLLRRAHARGDDAARGGPVRSGRIRGPAERARDRARPPAARRRRPGRGSTAQEIGYDRLVLATGSSAFVPPIPGRDAAGCFVYRTIEDLEAIRDWSATRPGGVGAVIGGGLLGLEAAYALVEAGDEGPRDRVRAAADGAAARRDRRRGAAPPDRGPGRRGPHRRRRPRRSSRARTAACGRSGSPTATSWTSTCWSSRPASGRATSWRAPPACRSASAAASSSTSAAAPRTPRSTRSASAPPTRALLRVGRPRLPDGARRGLGDLRRRPGSNRRRSDRRPWTPYSPAST